MINRQHHSILPSLPYRKIYLTLFTLIAIGLIWSRALLSISIGLIAISWILEGNFSEKFKIIQKRKSIVAITSLFWIPLFGLLFTDNIQYGLKELNTALPFLAIPLVAGTIKPFTIKEQKTFLYTFLVALILNTLYNLIKFYIDFEHGHDYRDMSHFISHIRYSFIIILSILGAFYFLKEDKYILSQTQKNFLRIAAIWLICFLFILQAFSGVATFIILLFIYLIRKAFISNKKIGIIIVTSILTIGIVTGSYIYIDILEPFISTQETPKELPSHTVNGNLYHHEFEDQMLENGNRVGFFQNCYELHREWSKRSEIPLIGSCTNGDNLEAVCIRYLTSRNLTKDSLGLSHLSDIEIKAIENGVANERFLNHLNPFNRVYIIIWELHSYANGMHPLGHSIPQRIEYMKAATHAIEKEAVTGYGTGDIFDVLHTSYDEINSPLKGNDRRKPHNQIITWAVSYGVLGMLFLIGAFIYAFGFEGSFKKFLPSMLFGVVLLSFLNEDTFGTQAGVSFTAFFYSLYVFLWQDTPYKLNRD